MQALHFALLRFMSCCECRLQMQDGCLLGLLASWAWPFDLAVSASTAGKTPGGLLAASLFSYSTASLVLGPAGLLTLPLVSSHGGVIFLMQVVSGVALWFVHLLCWARQN
jgi:hypothetical protein